MEEDLNILDNSALEETKTVNIKDGEKEEALVPSKEADAQEDEELNPLSKWDNVIKKEKEGKLEVYATPKPTIRDSAIDIDLEDYRDYLGSDIFIPEGYGTDLLDKQRADSQSWYEQAGNFVGQAVVGEIIGGTIEGLGYMLDVGSVLDVIKGDETEWGNFITKFGQGIREKTQDSLAIYQDPTAQGWGKMADSGWWFSNAVSVASTLSMLIPTTGAMRALSFAGKALGSSKGFQAIRKAVGMAEQMGTKGRWMTNGISQAVLSRNIENFMEAHGTFEDQKQRLLNTVNPETGKNFTIDEATKGASEAAASNWKNGWAMLLQDIPQYLAIGKVFNTATGKMMNAQNVASQKGIKAGLKPWQQKGSDISKTFFGEGGEEAYQFYIAERAKLKTDLKLGLISQKEYDKKMSDAIGSEEMMTSAFFGGLGGNIFQTVGPALNKALQSKSSKEYEENLESYYGDMVKNNAKQVSLMYHHLNSADQNASPVEREAVINEMMLNMTADALETNKFEQFMESIDQVSNMSEEDAESYNKQTGSEFNRELASSYAPEIKRKATEMRDKYLKHRNYYNKTTSSALAKIELQNNKYNDFISKKEKELGSIRNDVESSWENIASGSLRTKIDLREKKAVLTRRKKALNAQLKAETSDVKKNWIKKAIDLNESMIKDQRKEEYKNEKKIKELNAVDKEVEQNRAPGNIAAESAYQARKKEIYDALELQAVARERIFMNNEEMSHIKSAEGQKMIKSNLLQRRVDEYQSVEDLEKLKEDVDKSDVAKEDAEELKNKIGEKIATIKAKEKAEKAAEIRKNAEADAREKNSEINNDPAVVSNQNKTTIVDVVEDEDSEEMPVFEKNQLKDSEKAMNSKIGSGRLMAVLDRVDGTEAFQDWMETPFSKIGEVFDYTVSERSQKISKAQNDAIESFEKGNITQEVYDNLPIKLTLSGQPKIFSFIPTKPIASSSIEEKEAYKRGYDAQRKIIIDKLAAKEKVSSKVEENSGGDLALADYDLENNKVPDNSVLDIPQIGNDIDNIEILVTDDKGFLMSTEKVYDSRFGKQMTIEDSEGNIKPYKGGVFMVVKKANGDPFPLRLNLAKNTDDQAKLLADLLIDLVIPDPVRDQNGVFQKKEGKLVTEPKKFKLNSPISELSDEKLGLVKDLMSEEINMLDPEYKDPSIMELINSFVYVNQLTQGKTTELFVSGNDLFFNQKRMSPGFKENSEMKNDLINFLKNVKKRQFNIKLWSENKNYKKYVIDNQVISTNASTEGNLFRNTLSYDKASGTSTGRRIQIFMSPIEPKKSAQATLTSEGDISISNDYSDESGSTSAITIDENGNFVMSEPVQIDSNQAEEGLKLSGNVNAEKADDFNISKGTILYDNPDFSDKGIKIKAFNTKGSGSNQYLKGILFIDNDSKKEFWWNPNSRWNWKDMFVKKDIQSQQQQQIQSTQQVSGVKEGVSEIFNNNNELANIGTEEQYSEYLDTVFPNSKVKDIVYHGTDKKFDSFKVPKNYGAFFSSSRGVAKKQKELLLGKDTPLVKVMALVNIQNPKIGSVEGFDASPTTYLKDNDGLLMSNRMKNEVVVVTKESQIHILGSKKDIQGFKKFVNKPSQQSSDTRVASQPRQQSSDDVVLSEDIVFNSAIGQQVAWDSSSKSWVKKIDESMSISEETSFEKDGISYSYADWMPSDQQYQKQDLSTGKIVTENITKKEYDEARGSLDDNRFRVEEISFEEAKELYKYSKIAQKSSDTQIRKQKEDAVSLSENVTPISNTQITFESQIEEDDDNWDDIDMSGSTNSRDLEGMDSGEITETCN